MDSAVEMTEVSLAKLSTESGSPPLLLRLFLKLAKKANDMARRKDGSLNRRLTDLTEYKVPASEVPRHGVYTKDVVIDTQTGVWVRVFLPQISKEGAKKRPVIFHFHGGGFAVLCANFIYYDIFCRRLCRKGQAIVISVNYRRSPEYRYPIAYDDCFSVLRWLKGFKGELFQPYELDLSRCVLMGDSAGANIVHEVGCRAVREGGPLKIVAHVLLFPFFGGEERTAAELRLTKAPLVNVDNTDWHWRAFLPPGSTRDHPACNVFGPNAPDISALPLPRSLVAIAEFDPLKDWQLRYALGLAGAAKPVRLLYYKRGVHCCHLPNKEKLSSIVVADILAFINAEDASSTAQSNVP